MCVTAHRRLREPSCKQKCAVIEVLKEIRDWQIQSKHFIIDLHMAELRGTCVVLLREGISPLVVVRSSCQIVILSIRLR